MRLTKKKSEPKLIQCHACGKWIKQKMIGTVFCGAICKDFFYSIGHARSIVIPGYGRLATNWPQSWELPRYAGDSR